VHENESSGFSICQRKPPQGEMKSQKVTGLKLGHYLELGDLDFDRERVKNGRVPHLGSVGTLDSRVRGLRPS
jgi:hypothetical protein